MHISSNEIALAAVGVSGLIGIATPLATWRVAKQQRKADHAGRIFSDKRDAYKAITADAYRGRELVGECAERLTHATDAGAKVLVDQFEVDLNALHTTEPDTLAAMAVIAPDDVIKARHAFVDAWNTAVDPLLSLDRSKAGFAAAAKQAADKAFDDIFEPIGVLRRAVRDDVCKEP